MAKQSKTPNIIKQYLKPY